MKFLACISVVLFVALAAASEPKTKRYAPFLPHGIESKIAYTSVPHVHEYSNLQRIYSGVSPNIQAYSASYGYGAPQFHSGYYGAGYNTQNKYAAGLGYSNLAVDGAHYAPSTAYGASYSPSIAYGASYSPSTLFGSSYSYSPSVYTSNVASGEEFQHQHHFNAPHVVHTPIKEGPTTQNVQVRTVTEHVPVPVPQPYPVTVTKPVNVPQPYPVHVSKPVPVPVKVEVPVEVPRPYPVKVNQPVPVQVPVRVPVEIPRPVPVTVTRTVHVPVDKPVYVKEPVHVPVPEPQPYPVEVPHPVPVKVPHPVYVKEPHYQVVKSTAYVQPVVKTYTSTSYPTSYGVETHYPSVYASGLKTAGHVFQPASYVKSYGYHQPASYVSGLKSASYYHHPATYSKTVYPEISASGAFSGAYPTHALYNFQHHGKYLDGAKQYSAGIYSNHAAAAESVYPHNFNLYGKYLSGEKYYTADVQPLNYLRSVEAGKVHGFEGNAYGLLKSYIPSVYGGYSGLKSYTGSEIVNSKK